MSHGKKNEKQGEKTIKEKKYQMNKQMSHKTVLEAHSMEGNVTFVCLKCNDEFRWRFFSVLEAVVRRCSSK